MVTLSELARKAGIAAGYATHYGKKAVSTYRQAKALRKYTKKLTKAQIKSELNKAKRLGEHRPLTRKEKIVTAALRIQLLQKSRRKTTKRRRTHRKSRR